MSKEDSEENKECPLELPGWINFLQQYASEKTMTKLHLIGVVVVAISGLGVLFVAQQSSGNLISMSIILPIIAVSIFLLFYISDKRNITTRIKYTFAHCLIEEILRNELDKNILRNIWFSRRNFYGDMHRKRLKKPDSQETIDLLKCYAKEFIEKYKDL